MKWEMAAYTTKLNLPKISVKSDNVFCYTGEYVNFEYILQGQSMRISVMHNFDFVGHFFYKVLKKKKRLNRFLKNLI